MSEAEQDAVIGRIVRDLAVNKQKLAVMTSELERYEKAFNALGSSLSNNIAADFNLKAASRVITDHTILQGFETQALVSFLEEYTQVRQAVESGSARLRQLSGG